MEPVSLPSITDLSLDTSCREKTAAEKGIEQVLKLDVNQPDLPQLKNLEQILTFVKNNKDQILTMGTVAKSRNHARLIKKKSSGLPYDLIICTEKGEVAVKLNGRKNGTYKIVKTEFVLNDFGLRAIAKQRVNHKNMTPERAQREIEMIQLFKDNPYVVKIHGTKNYKGSILESTKDDENFKVFTDVQMISMPYYKPIEKYLGSFSKEQLVKILKELCLGVDYIHQKWFFHRDIKPDNILLDVNQHIKIADFGHSSPMNHPSTYLSGGTPIYIAPEFQEREFIKKKTSDTPPLQYTKEGDAWSVGVTMTEICYKNFPFTDGKEPTKLHELYLEHCYLGKKTWPQTFDHRVINGQKAVASEDKTSIDYIIFKFLRPKEERFLPKDALPILEALQSKIKQ